MADVVSTRLSVLFLTIAGTFYLGALLSLVLNPYLALCGAVAIAASAAALWRRLRETELDLSSLWAAAVGVVLIAWIRPKVVDSISWDVVSYGLMKYPELKVGIVGPYFSYGNVYEFLLSYVDQLLPPVGGIPLVHSLSLLFLAIFVCNYARATGSRLALAAGIVMLFFDPTNTIRPELSYIAAGKNDVFVAALVLQTWAIFLGRRNSRGTIDAFEFLTTNAIAACAVGVKMSASLPLALPLILYWAEFIGLTARAMLQWRWVGVAGAVVLAWLFFCWQYVANLFVLGAVTHPGMARLGASLSVIGLVGDSPIELARSSPRVFLVALTLAVLVLVGLAQRRGREVVLRLSALIFV
jgi:hypothetical protein